MLDFVQLIQFNCNTGHLSNILCRLACQSACASAKCNSPVECKSTEVTLAAFSSNQQISHDNAVKSITHLHPAFETAVMDNNSRGWWMAKLMSKTT